MDMVWIGVGAAVGANARYYVGQWVAAWLGVSFPAGTLIVNLSGSFLIGVIATLLGERLLVDPHWRLLLVVGLLGGYTTFSSFSFEVVTLLQADRWLAATAYVLASVVLGLVACLLGIGLVRATGGGV
jgi:CrcB protein